MRHRSVGKGLLAGALGGAVGTLVLNLFQKASLEGTRAVEDHTTNAHQYTREQQQLLKTYEQAHITTAEHAAAAVGTSLPAEYRKASAPITEFAFGIVCAAVYGAVAEYLPAVTVGFGGVFGAVLFTGASEIVLPTIGFVPSPEERTPVQHAGGLSGNVVYGVTTEAVRRLLR